MYNKLFCRQLGDYKRYVRNTRYPEGCIAEQYIVQECITYCKLYMDNTSMEDMGGPQPTISVVSHLVKPRRRISRKRLDEDQIDIAHWCVMEHCDEAQYYINCHKELFNVQCSNYGDDDRVKHFLPYFQKWVSLYNYFLYINFIFQL